MSDLWRRRAAQGSRGPAMRAQTARAHGRIATDRVRHSARPACVHLATMVLSRGRCARRPAVGPGAVGRDRDDIRSARGLAWACANRRSAADRWRRWDFTRKSRRRQSRRRQWAVSRVPTGVGTGWLAKACWHRRARNGWRARSSWPVAVGDALRPREGVSIAALVVRAPTLEAVRAPVGLLVKPWAQERALTPRGGGLHAAGDGIISQRRDGGSSVAGRATATAPTARNRRDGSPCSPSSAPAKPPSRTGRRSPARSQSGRIPWRQAGAQHLQRVGQRLEKIATPSQGSSEDRGARPRHRDPAGLTSARSETQVEAPAPWPGRPSGRTRCKVPSRRRRRARRTHRCDRALCRSA